MTGTNTHAEPVAQHRRPWGALLAWVAVLGLLAIVGIGLLRAQQGAVGVGSKPQPFTLRTFDGVEYDTGEMVGHVVVINFWASWCMPCEQEAGVLEQAYQQFKDQGVVFLGVNYVDTEPEAKAYLEEFGITYPNGPDLGTRISQAFRISGVPETYILGRDGRLAHIMIGPYASLGDIVQAIETVQAQSPRGMWISRRRHAAGPAQWIDVMDLGSLLIMVGLIVAVVAFLARPLVENRATPVTAGDHRLSALQAERDAVLTMIREIEMDHAMGKIGADDFQAQRAALVACGSAVLRELDALGGSNAPDEVDAAIEAAVATRRHRPPSKPAGFCAHCGRALQRGDRFCAGCGTPVHKETSA